MNKTDNFIENGSPPRKRAVTREMSLSLFESGLSYMLEAGWNIVAKQTRDEQDRLITILTITGMGYRVDEKGATEFYADDIPILVETPAIIGMGR